MQRHAFAQGVPIEDAVHPLWRPLKDAAGRTAFLNPFTGRLPNVPLYWKACY